VRYVGRWCEWMLLPLPFPSTLSNTDKKVRRYQYASLLALAALLALMSIGFRGHHSPWTCDSLPRNTCKPELNCAWRRGNCVEKLTCENLLSEAMCQSEKTPHCVWENERCSQTWLSILSTAFDDLIDRISIISGYTQ